MHFQALTVAAVVACSFAYAAWTLAPQTLRSALARGLSEWPFPAFLRQRLLAAATTDAGCGCSGCDKAPAAEAKGASSVLGAQAQPLVFHPRKGR
jgi:hypothetical protein